MAQVNQQPGKEGRGPSTPAAQSPRHHSGKLKDHVCGRANHGA